MSFALVVGVYKGRIRDIKGMILLMVQKSCEKTTWDVMKPYNRINYQQPSTGERRISEINNRSDYPKKNKGEGVSLKKTSC